MKVGRFSDFISFAPLASMLLLCTSLSAQSSPTANSTASAMDTVPTLHASTHLVVLDVSVFDWKGSPVTGLSQDAFHLSEDGREQTIKTFEEHRPLDPKVAQQRLTAVAAALPPNTFTNFKPFHDSAVTVIVLDDLNGTWGREVFEKQLVDYLKTASGGSFAVYHLDSGLHLLQGLTTDTGKAIAAIQSIDAVPHMSPAATFVQRRAIVGNAIDQMTRYLAPIPGRKTMLWFTAAIGHMLSSSNGQDSDPEEGSLFCEWTDSLQQHRIDVYRLDPTREKGYAGLGCHVGRYVGDTIASIIDASGYYYTFSYSPSNDVWNGKYRHFKVTVNTHGLPWKGVALDYRDGYFGRTNDGSVQSAVVAPPPGGESPALQQAMAFGAPSLDGVIFEATTTSSPTVTHDPAGEAAPPGNYLTSQLRAAGYREMAIRVAVRANQLGLIQGGDTPSPTERLEVAVVVYDATGHPVNSKKSTVAVGFTGPEDPRLSTAAITADLGTQVPAQGTYILRIGARDVASDRAGAVEIPADQVVPDKN